MKDELQPKLLEILTSIQSATKQAADFTLGQLPDVVHQWWLYELVSTVGGLALVVAIFGGCVWRIVVNLKNFEPDPYYPSDRVISIRQVAAYAIYGTTAIAATAQATLAVNKILLLSFAPKVWLLKEIALLVK